MWIITEICYFTEKSGTNPREHKILAGIGTFFCCFFSPPYQKPGEKAGKF